MKEREREICYQNKNNLQKKRVLSGSWIGLLYTVFMYGEISVLLKYKIQAITFLTELFLLAIFMSLITLQIHATIEKITFNLTSIVTYGYT